MTDRPSTHQIILNLLRESTGPLSGPQLAERLAISRTAVWKAIRKLESLGYGIASDPSRGYRLESTPDRLLPEEVVPLLRTRWLGKHWLLYPELGSTNDRALELATEDAPHGTVVVAERQTSGRGRMDRHWISPPGGGIYLSMLLRSPLPLERAPQCSLVAGLALVKALADYPGLTASLKWPNDVLVDGAKIAGILTEMQGDPDRVRFVVVGVGINVSQDFGQAEATELRYPAASLNSLAGRAVDRCRMAVRFLECFEVEFERFREHGLAPLRPELERFSSVLGRSVKVLVGNETISGKADAITADGALRVLTPAGDHRIIWSGEVSRVIPDPVTEQD